MKAVRRSGWIEKVKGAGGRVVWRVTYFDVDGRRRRESTDAATRQAARRILADRQNAVEQARLQKLGSVRELLAPAPSMTLRAFADEYIKHIRAHCTHESARRNESHLRTYLLPRLGNLALAEITPGHVQRYAHLAPSNLRTAVLALDRTGAAGVKTTASAPRVSKSRLASI